MTSETEHGEARVPKLILFVTGDAPRSRRARENLAKALDSLDFHDVKPMEVDLLTQPEQTITYSVFATPALLRTDDKGRISVLYGDLTDERKLLDFLGDLPAGDR
jgi:circadian clock protein KaiB